MPTTHVYPFNLTRDETWRESTTETIEGQPSQPCTQYIYTWDGSSPSGNYTVTTTDTDDSSVSSALETRLYRLSSRFNSDPKFQSSFEFGCPKPVNINSRSLGFNPNERREFNHRIRKWKNVKGDPRTPLTTAPKKTLVRKPNALLSKYTVRYNFSGDVLVQRREIRPGWNEGDDPVNKYVYIIDCIYQGNIGKAQLGSNPSILDSYVAPLWNLCQPRNLRSLYTDLVDVADEKALRSVYVKLKDQKIDLATALAEGAQTVSLIADLASRLAKFLLHLKKLRLDQAASDLLPIVKDLLPLTRKKAANDFLAYRYGISPLINDIQGAAEQLAAYVMALPKTFVRSRAVASEPFQTSYTVGSDWQYDETRNVTVTVKYKVTFQWQPFEVTALEKLGFTNPANVIWELVPFSFVVDWFLPIGNFLNTVSSADNLTVTTVERVIHIMEDRNVYGARVAAFSGEPTYAVNGSASATQREIWTIREILPLPSLPLPKFKNPISKGHVANAVALISQLVK